MSDADGGQIIVYIVESNPVADEDTGAFKGAEGAVGEAVAPMLTYAEPGIPTVKGDPTRQKSAINARIIPLYHRNMLIR